MLTILDEYTRECLAIGVDHRLTHDAVVHRLTDLFFRRGIPEYIRNDNGIEFTEKAVPTWLNRLGVRTLYLKPRSPWENGYIESFSGKLLDEVLRRDVFDTLLKAKVLVQLWRVEYNHIRPHSALGYRSPAQEVIIPLSA